MQEGPHRSFHLPQSKPHYPPSMDFRTEHVLVDLTVDFPSKSIAGSCTLRISPIASPIERILLDACEMRVSSVTLDGAEARFEYDNERISIPLKAPMTGPHEVRVTYSSTPNEGVYFTGPDEGYPGKEFQVWTHGEAEFSRYWYPCHDHPNGKCSSEMIIRVPKDRVVISNGRLISVKEEGDWTSFHWKESFPHSTYLNSFVAGSFGTIAQESEGVPLQYYFPESRRKDALRYFGETPKMIEVFNELTGVKYPYAKYAQTTVEDFIYGGMENVGATTLATNYFCDERSEPDFQTSYTRQSTNAQSLVAHELAHQWFGDFVTCSDWSHAWLNEGFATYFQALYFERSRGIDEARWDMSVKAKTFFEEDDSEYRRPIVDKTYVFPDDVFDSATYEKGAWMIHELRYVLGDALFFSGVREYLSRFGGWNADTGDFRKSMEEASGRSLEQFFEQSFFRGGYPEFEVTYDWNGGTRTATVEVKQVQRTDATTPVFCLPCDLVFYTETGRKAKRIEIDSADGSFSFELDSRPRIVEFDPQEWLLKKVTFKRGVDLLMNQLAESQDASSRAAAATELGATKNDGVVAALTEAASREQFWLVRANSFRALGELGTSAALTALLGVSIPEHRRVRRAFVEALGHFKDERAVALVRRFLAEDQSPYVQCEAALALGKSGFEGTLGLLKASMSMPSPNDTLAEACLEAMGKLKGDGARPMILESLRYGKPPRVRIGAMRAMKARGFMHEDEAAAIDNLIRTDKDFRVRQFAVSDLASALGDRRLVDAMRAASERDKDPRIRRKSMQFLDRLPSTGQ